MENEGQRNRWAVSSDMDHILMQSTVPKSIIHMHQQMQSATQMQERNKETSKQHVRGDKGNEQGKILLNPITLIHQSFGFELWGSYRTSSDPPSERHYQQAPIHLLTSSTTG